MKVWLTYDHDTAQYADEAKRQLEEQGHEVLISGNFPPEAISECDAIAVV